jgi:hypothetical protein
MVRALMRGAVISWWLGLLCVSACTERALSLGGDPTRTNDGGVPSMMTTSGVDLAAAKPPGGLPVEYCERIITLNDTNQLALFDPVALTWEDTATLLCGMGSAGPYSIALDHAGVLWVEYSDGRLFTADPQTGTCTDVAFATQQAPFQHFDITFAPDESGAEQLYVSGVADFGKSALGKIDPQALVLTNIGPTNVNVELTRTGAGELWGMVRGTSPHAVRIDKTTAAFDDPLTIPVGDITGDGVAFSWFNGSFYVFILPHNSSTNVSLLGADGTFTPLLQKTGRRIISATIAACL